MQVTSATTTNNSSSLYAALSGPSSTSGASPGGKTLGAQDFMQLLATQMQNQDPMNPTSDTQFIAQMAQFSALQQSTEMVTQQKQLIAAGYLGRQVTLLDSSGNTISGTVSAVNTSSSEPQLVVNGTSYALSTLRTIHPASS
jgi:flagellar basal-body rod modification protein FlgD